MNLQSLLSLLLIACLASQSGCQKLSFLRSQSPDDKEDPEEGKTQFIGDKVTIAGLYPIQIEGVGLVVGLDNTGGDEPPSIYRTILLNDMRRRDVKNPNLLLQSPSTALVLIRAALPPVIQKGDRFDIEIVLPENSEATSLAGGYLMEADLAEQAIVPGRGPIKGHKMASAQGPVLVSTRAGEKGSLSSVLKRGRVLGGGVYVGGQQKKDRMLGLYLRNDFRSVRNSKKVADRIGARFSDYENGLKKPLAKALTDQHIELKVHPKYKENYVRYVQVIRNIALRETDVEERDRMERLSKSLLVPETASKSALELEALGIKTIPILKEGLKSPSSEVRFYAADALAYLGDASGAEELAAAAANEEAFRVFALAALAIIDEGTTHELLRDLMNEYDSKTLARLNGGADIRLDAADSVEPASGSSRPVTLASLNASRHGAETRYGAFRALWTLDKNDPFIRGETIKDEFKLHVLRTEGEPMIHLTRHRVPEVVLFGAEQEFRTPVALAAGRYIVLNAPAGSDTVTISRFEPDKPDQQLVTSTRVADIIRAVGDLGGSYPDVAQMLTQAKRQSNAAGRLEVDALPEAGRFYHRPITVAEGEGTVGPAKTKTRVGRASMVPNIFPAMHTELGRKPALQDKDEPEPSPDENGDDGESSVTDARESADEEHESSRFSKFFKNPFKRAAN